MLIIKGYELTGKLAERGSRLPACREIRELFLSIHTDDKERKCCGKGEIEGEAGSLSEGVQWKQRKRGKGGEEDLLFFRCF